MTTESSVQAQLADEQLDRLETLLDDPALAEEDLAAYCKENFTAYKRPKLIEFRDELPKSNVGKILRRELRT